LTPRLAHAKVGAGVVARFCRVVKMRLSGARVRAGVVAKLHRGPKMGCRDHTWASAKN